MMPLRKIVTTVTGRQRQSLASQILFQHTGIKPLCILLKVSDFLHGRIKENNSLRSIRKQTIDYGWRVTKDGIVCKGQSVL